MHQAIIFELKNDEGVPPSAILIGVTPSGLSMFIYKVGKLINSKVVNNRRIDEWLAEIINFIKETVEIDILPSRILLYGVEKILIEKLQNRCVSFPWTSKLNFYIFLKWKFYHRIWWSEAYLLQVRASCFLK